MIRQRNANAGQYVTAGMPIVGLVQMHPLRLRTAVPEREARTIRVGQPVRVTVEGAPGIHDGHVARISPVFDEANRTLLVETEVSNTAGILRPGGFSRAEIIVASIDADPQTLEPERDGRERQGDIDFNCGRRRVAPRRIGVARAWSVDRACDREAPVP